MEQQTCRAGGIPALLWGPRSDWGLVAVHGSQSHKADLPIQRLAEAAAGRGWQVLSVDLPEHGDRTGSAARCKAMTCVPELAAVLEEARRRWTHVGLFANSLGAYFALTAWQEEPLEGAWLLAPVLDLERLIGNMLSWSGAAEDQLRQAGELPTALGQTLYWDDLRWIRAHPIRRWDTPTWILRGGKDSLCGEKTAEDFSARFGCRLQTVPDAGHDFRAPEEVGYLSRWLEETLCQGGG